MEEEIRRENRSSQAGEDSPDAAGFEDKGRAIQGQEMRADPDAGKGRETNSP